MENPYLERQQLGYDLSNLSNSEAIELEDLLDDESVSDFELEFALRRIRLKYLNVVTVLYLNFGVAVCLLTAFLLRRQLMNPAEVLTFWTWLQYSVAFAFFGIMAISGIGIMLRTRWGKRLAQFTSYVSLILFPLGTFFGLYALRSIQDCDPEFN